MAQKIIIAQGIEVRDWDGPALAKFLKDNCDAKTASTFTYPQGAGAKATHEIEVVYTMAEFKKALDTPGAFVVYDGHSRYGQGPAFGDAGIAHVPDKKTYPVNPWGVHFRMGFDATDTECVEDLLEHSVTPTEYDLTTSGAKAFLPGVLVKAATLAKSNNKAIKSKKIKARAVCATAGAWRLFNTCEPAIATTSTARGDKPLDNRHFYQRIIKKPQNEFMASVKVGSADLDASSLKCDILFMGSCSSQVHFYRPLVKRRKAAKSRCKFLLTAHLCSASQGTNFLEQVLLKKANPMTKKGLKALIRALNGYYDAGAVGIY